MLTFDCSEAGFGGSLRMGVYSRSSWAPACLSVENGVLISKRGRCSRCLEIRLSLARGGARAKEERGLRQRREGILVASMTSGQCWTNRVGAS